MKNYKTIMIMAIVFTASLFVHSEPKVEDSELRSKITVKYKELSKKFTCSLINAVQLKKAIKEGNVVLVDIRTPKEISVSRIPGAVTEAEFNKNKNKYKNKMVVAYCTIGYRSGLFASKTKDIKVYNLLGGVLMWSHTGGKFANDKGETDKVHVYSKDWNYLNSNYKAVTE